MTQNGNYEYYNKNLVSSKDTVLNKKKYNESPLSNSSTSVNSGIRPTGKILITDSSEVNVTPYSSAQVYDSNLKPENIKQGVRILGTTGSMQECNVEYNDTNIKLEGTYDGSPIEVKLGETWKGTEVPNDKYIEKVYFNTQMSVEEVRDVLSQLEYNGSPYAGIEGEKNAYYLLYFENTSWADGFPTVIIGTYGVNDYYIFEFERGFLFLTKPIGGSGNFTGWRPGFNGVITFNKNAVYNEKNLSGLQNHKVKSVVSITPFEKVMSNTVYLNDYLVDKKLPLEITADTSIPDKYIVPKGKINITNTQEIDVTQYAKAQVVDENLKAENIAEGVEVLGITGTMKGAGINALKKLLDYTKSCYNMFYENNNITDLTGYLEYSDTENVTDMTQMFYNCSKLKKIPPIDTHNVVKMSGMFAGCKELEEVTVLNTSNLNRAAVTNLFYCCYNLKKVPQIDTSSEDLISSMFERCYKLEKVDVTYYRINTSSSLKWCCDCYSLKSIFIRSFGDRYVLESNSFYNCYHLEGKVDATYNPNGDKDGYIFVPKNMVETLKNATNWSNYADQIKPIFAIEYWGNGMVSETVNNNNETILNAVSNSGSSFKGWYKGTVDNVYTTNIVGYSSYEAPQITYPFELNENGYYQNTNQKKDNSFSKGRFNFNIENENQKLRITYLQSSENGYDYGVIGNVDSALADNTNTSGYTTLKGENNTIPKEIIIEGLSVGNHFIDIKYIKDSSSASGTDTLQVKVDVVTVEVEKVLNVEDTPYNTENEINIGVVDEMTMEAVYLVAIFE